MSIRAFTTRFGAAVLTLLLGALAQPALAADYYVPTGGSLPANCTLTNAALVTCTSLNLGNNDRIYVTAAVTLQVNGTFNYGGNIRINEGGTTANLTLNVTGSWNASNGAHINANINTTNFNLNQNSYIGGNLVVTNAVNASSNYSTFAGSITAGGNISLGQGTNVSGNVISSGGTLSTQNSVTIGGNVSTSGNINLNQGADIGGSVVSTNGTITTSGSVDMGGGVSAYGTINIGQNNTISTGGITSSNGNISMTSGSVVGDINAPNGSFTTSNAVDITGSINTSGNISLGQETTVTGNATTTGGTFTSGNQVVVDGNISANGSINLGYQSEVGGNVGSTTGGITTNNQVQIGGSVDVSGDINLGYQSSVGGDVDTDNGGATISNGVTIGGGLHATGDINLGYQSDLEGDVETDGNVSTSNEVHIGGNIAAGGNVDLNYNTSVDGNINTPGTVNSNNSSVGGYVNAGSTSGIDEEETTVCNTDPDLGDDNSSPCPGFEPEPDVLFYKLSFASSTLTCEPLSVTVQSCADAGCATLEPITGDVDVIASGPASVTPATASFAASGSDSVSLTLPTAGTYTLSLTNIDVPAAGSLQCSPASCQSTANASTFSWRESAVQSTVQTKTAGVPFTVELVAQACSGVFQNETIAVDLSIECNDPSSCSSGGSLLSVDSTDLAEAPSSVEFDLDFDGSSIAELAVNYDDAGSIILKAHADLPGGVEIEGSTNAFVVKPGTIGFALSNATSYTDPSVFGRAGDDFTVVLTARSSGPGNPVTPNFGNESSPELLTLDGSAAVVMPNPGVTTGPVFVITPFAKTAAGTFTSTQIRYGEVGRANFSAHILDNDYLGAGNVTIVDSTNAGLFIPWEFSIEDSEVVPACDMIVPGFTYMGQNFEVSITARAWARLGDNSLNVAANYAGSLAVANVALVAADTDSDTELSNRLSPDTLGLSWAAGEGVIEDAEVLVEKDPETGPYLEFQLGSQLVQDDVALGSTDFNAAVANCASTSACNAVALDDSQVVVLGRLVLSDTYGPETGNAEVSLESQYYDGDRFVRTANLTDGIFDSCTPVDYTKLEALSTLGSSVRGGTSDTLEAARNPVGSLYWTPPLLQGHFMFRYNADDQPWLRDEDGTAPQFDVNGNPTARASFGSYRGHDRILNWQLLPL